MMRRTVLFLSVLGLMLASCDGGTAQDETTGTITISVQDWAGVEGYRLLAVVWSGSEPPESELEGAAFWTIIDSDPFSGVDTVHPPIFGGDLPEFQSWGDDDYLWDETAALEPGVYRIEFWANPGELKPYGSHVPAASNERRCMVEGVGVKAGEDTAVVVSEVPVAGDDCP